LRPPLHTISFLASLLDADRLPLCLRSVLGRIWESKNFSQIDVESASRACDRRRGRARAREAAARRCGRSVFFAVLSASLSGAQVAYACTLSLYICE
jgi:hypothetical protein